MTEWEPIRRTGPPEPQDVDELTGRIELRFQLSAVPPLEWASHVERELQVMVDPSVGVWSIQLQDRTIVVLSKPSKGEFAEWTDGIDQAIAHGNTYYADVLVEQARIQQAADYAVENKERLLDEAREWVADLDPPESQNE
jgi:hypothetical protein